MADKAHVTSTEALETFRANLVLYVSRARPTVEEVSSDVMRTRLWLQNDQRLHWESQLRRRTKELEQAQAALSGARLSDLRGDKTVEQNAVRRAKAALEEAEQKLKRLKQWNREFDTQVQPLVKQLEKLHTVLSNDMLLANAFLAKAISTLAAYAEMAAPSVATGPAAAPPNSSPAQPPTERSSSEPEPEPAPPAIDPKEGTAS
jgi:chromosome segregation ATPase